jgi:hypothetical protein
MLHPAPCNTLRPPRCFTSSHATPHATCFAKPHATCRTLHATCYTPSAILLHTTNYSHSSTSHSYNHRATPIIPAAEGPIRPRRPDTPSAVRGPGLLSDVHQTFPLPHLQSLSSPNCHDPALPPQPRSLFNQVQAHPASQLAPSAWGAIVMPLRSARQAPSGTGPALGAPEPSKVASST